MKKDEHKAKLAIAVEAMRVRCWHQHLDWQAKAVKRVSDMLNASYNKALDELNKRHERELARRDAILAGANRQLGKYERQIGDLHREINELKKGRKRGR